ncbi:hypothetical protein JCGZ_06246 [Jatropha curcas]|uniref:Thionin-like protein 2 n=1 Tax=Jatropha curcas TaxID=180498 RepID=A0A067KY57_JATCU|nr:hypothetical protein JCGZ_06246 [Jatropha curcas]
MEGIKGVKVTAIGMVVIILMILPGQVKAIDKCFPGCFFGCLTAIEKINPDGLIKNLIPCVQTCLKECLLHSTSSGFYYCNLGCSIDSCITNEIGDVVKMESCVKNCSTNSCNGFKGK